MKLNNAQAAGAVAADLYLGVGAGSVTMSVGIETLPADDRL